MSRRPRTALIMLLAGAVAVAAVVLLVRGGEDEPEAEEPTAPGAQFDAPERVLERGDRATAVVTTSHGTFDIALDTEGSPKTANSFAFLAEQGFYDGTTFHRIAPGFVIQGGDPTGTGTGGPGYFVDEPPGDRTEYLRGTVAMAKSQVEPPGRSGSQFFVVTGPDAGLPPDYAVLGEVTSGMETVARIGELGDAGTEQPLETVTIESIAIERG